MRYDFDVTKTKVYKRSVIIQFDKSNIYKKKKRYTPNYQKRSLFSVGINVGLETKISPKKSSLHHLIKR